MTILTKTDRQGEDEGAHRSLRKLLRIIHAIVRDNRDYVEQYQAPEGKVIKEAA